MNWCAEVAYILNGMHTFWNLRTWTAEFINAQQWVLLHTAFQKKVRCGFGHNHLHWFCCDNCTLHLWLCATGPFIVNVTFKHIHCNAVQYTCWEKKMQPAPFFCVLCNSIRLKTWKYICTIALNWCEKHVKVGILTKKGIPSYIYIYSRFIPINSQFVAIPDLSIKGH